MPDNGESVAVRYALLPLQIEQGAHAGLLLHRYLKKQDDVKAREDLLDCICKVKASEAYKAAFDRWKQAATGQKLEITLRFETPLAIGLGNESPIEVGFTFHHTYGMPIVPGSALKGLCHRVARRVASLSKEQCQDLFGDTSIASAFVFHDAWYDPNSVGGYPFHRDVVTTHHPAYYQTQESKWPTDFDDPVPVPFLVVRPGACFYFLFEMPSASPQWAAFVESLLKWGGENLGIGAKTNAGYGRFEVERVGGSKTSSAEELEEWKDVEISVNPSTLEAEVKASDYGTAVTHANDKKNIESLLRPHKEELKKHKWKARATVKVAKKEKNYIRDIQDIRFER
ncbi:MAG TPA: type III-B CRISPR module RAMP protein Cmr6 [Chthonomonas sp.]|uniref:type III-B CRISPR module RAMP protein Cmr6 n=1 Tax=Chthonomonas sp. TaxID=2282153 RepID=UPI002B4AF18E|nr:type III-B CRISPR module RAMP protein Cmr6 [Chthonomonas sp.]HLI49721.1 type III-B CRISPR module RAMP protein Cmr6 [Chthonomonas sp.]